MTGNSNLDWKGAEGVKTVRFLGGSMVLAIALLLVIWAVVAFVLLLLFPSLPLIFAFALSAIAGAAASTTAMWRLEKKHAFERELAARDRRNAIEAEKQRQINVMLHAKSNIPKV